jgi:hypothetical protein
MNLIPNPPAAVEFGLAFGFGWLVHRQPQLLETWTRRWPLNLAAALVFTIACLAQLGLAPVVTPAEPGLAKLAYAA